MSVAWRSGSAGRRASARCSARCWPSPRPRPARRRGASLLAVYALGLGVPFLATGLAFGRMAGAFGWVKRHYAAITITSACALGFFGVLLALSKLTWVTSQLQAALRHAGLSWLIFPG